MTGKKRYWMIPLSLLFFLFVTALIPFIRFKLASSDPRPREVRPSIVAHRGASGVCPENTIVAFQKALEQGADVIELDVHLTADGGLVVIHDATVDRTTDGSGAVASLRTNELLRLDAGSWFDSDHKDARIPLLEDVIDLVNGRAQILIELKWRTDGEPYPHLVEKVVDVIRSRNASSWIILQSFHRAYLQVLNDGYPDIRFHQLVFGTSTWLPLYYDNALRAGTFQPYPRAESVNVFYLYATSGMVQAQHQQGRKVGVFTLNSAADMARAWNIGVDAIITNHVEQAPTAKASGDL